MKKLFIQFYLLLFVCFLVMSLLVGLVYKFTAERAGKQSLDDLMNSSLYLMRSELREIPPHDWGKTLKEMDLNLSFDLRVEPLSKYHLDDISMHRLRGDAPRDKCTLSCAINGIHAAFHYLKKNYISGCVMTVPTG